LNFEFLLSSKFRGEKSLACGSTQLASLQKEGIGNGEYSKRRDEQKAFMQKGKD
jgi:hypothetical protein